MYKQESPKRNKIECTRRVISAVGLLALILLTACVPKESTSISKTKNTSHLNTTWVTVTPNPAPLNTGWTFSP